MPLHLAVNGGQVEIVKRLIEWGADVDGESSGYSRTTPLMQAVCHRHHTCTVLLLDSGADVNKTNSVGQAPIHAAAQGGDHELVALLIASGANLEQKNEKGLTGLDIAMAERAAYIHPYWNAKFDSVIAAYVKGHYGPVASMLEEGESSNSGVDVDTSVSRSGSSDSGVDVQMETLHAPE